MSQTAAPSAEPQAETRRGSGLRSPWTALIVFAVVFIALYPVLSDDLYYQNMIILSLVFAIGASG